jgi:hypothetical protein
MPSTIALSYLHSIIGKVGREPLREILGEVISLSRGKGIDAYVYYILGFKPRVKRFEE